MGKEKSKQKGNPCRREQEKKERKKCRPYLPKDKH